jgi:hypothetical protein
VVAVIGVTTASLAACGTSNRHRIERAASGYDGSPVTRCESVGHIGRAGQEAWRCRFQDGLAYCFTLRRDDSTNEDLADVMFRDPECPEVQ